MGDKRIFSKNDTYNYNDYLKIKKGNQLFANYKSNNAVYLNKFINYETFLLLTKTYYEKLNLNKYSVQPPSNMNDAKVSFLCYERLLSHIGNCTLCSYTNDILSCKEVQQILYPYGESIVRNDKLNRFAFPYRLNVEQFCNKKCEPVKPEIACLVKEEEEEDKFQLQYSNNRNRFFDPEINYSLSSRQVVPDCSDFKPRARECQEPRGFFILDKNCCYSHDGATSVSGPRGLPGATGPRGLPGATGPRGTAGLQGLQGIAGATGARGPAGLQGIQGKAGATGARGPAGIQGTAGATGARGPAGTAGLQGEQGTAGLQG